MANTTISQLSSVSAPLVGTDVFLITRAGASYKVATSVIQDFLEAANNTWTGTNTFNTNIVLGSGITIDGVDPSTIATTYLGLAGGTMTGDIVLAGAPSTGLHPTTKTYVDAADALKANLASPTLTGTPLAPTAATSTSTTQIASTAFVKNVLDALIFNQTAVASTPKSLVESETGFILVDHTASAAVVLELPEIGVDLSFPKRTIYYIKDTGLNATTNNITINAAGSDTIDGAASVTISTDGEDLILFNNGATEWYIIAKDTIASATKAGVIELATSAEALALTDATRAITPSTLGAVLEDKLYKVTTKNAAGPTTLLESESGLISVTRTSTGTCALELPSAAGLTDASKTYFEIVDAGRNASTYNITITAAAGTINGSASAFVMSSDGASAKFYNDGTNWITAADTQAAVTEAEAATGLWTDASTYIHYNQGVNIGGTTAPSGLLTINKASGDPQINFSIADADKFVIGVDDSDSDTFKIGTGSTLTGSTDWFQITAAGLTTISEKLIVSNASGYTTINNGSTLSSNLINSGNLNIASNGGADATIIGIGAMIGGSRYVHKIEVYEPNVGFDTAIGGDLALIAGPVASVVAADTPAGRLYLKSGLNAGVGESEIIFETGQSVGSGVRATYQEYMRISGIDGISVGKSATQKVGFYGATPIVKPVAATDLGTVLSDLGLRVAGTAYPITTTGAVNFGAGVIFSGIETIAAGGTTTALSLTKSLHSIAADAGGDIFTLADGTIGQIMTIVGNSNMAGTATITPTNLAGGTSVTFNAAGDSVILQFVDTDWYILGGNSYAVI